MNKSIRTGFRAKSLLIAISSITAALAAPELLYAQDIDIEEIQITGSRIRATDGMAAPTPVTTMSIGELANFDPGGTVADQLDALPQFFSTQSSARGGGALFGSAGGSFLNMRSLGANRTLVLLDGSRIVPGDKAGSVNVETLPNALIRTVDVVTGGASAAYGADALGGVTNFVLDREFQGLKISAGTGITEFGDGDKYNFSIAGGREFGKLNVIASFDERFANAINRDPLDLDSDFFKRWGHVQNPAWKASDPKGTNPQRLTLPWVSSSNSSPFGLISAPGTPLNRMKFLPDGSGVTPFINGDVTSIGGTNSMSGGPEGDVWNRAFGPGGIDTAEVVGRNAFVGLQYRLTDSLTVYAQGLSGRSESNQATPYGSYELESPWSATVYRDNAYLPDSVAAIMDANNMTRFTLNKVGSFRGAPSIGINQRDHNVLTTQSWSVGFGYELPNGWDLTGNWQSGESEKRSQVYNKTRVDRMILAMDAVRHPTTGAIMCNVTLHNPSLADLAASPSLAGKYTSRSNIAHALDPSVPLEPLYSPIGLDNTIRDCVPYNVMGSEGLTQAAIDYIGTDKFGIGNIEQDFAELLVQGEIYEGWGYGPVSLAAGVNYREQSMTDGAHPIDVDDLGPPLNDEALGIRGFPGGYTGGSANLHMF
jgi:iron complex outermembrane receptor protein